MSALSSRSAFTKPRIVALVVMALLTAALVWLRFSPGPETVSVPQGAKAGNLALQPCQFDTENGTQSAECGTLVVPENHANPQSRLIALPVVRLLARSTQPGEPVFYLEGGPGITNVAFKQAARYATDRDVVMVGYRGVDGSVRLDCPEVTSASMHSTDLLGDASFRAVGAAYQRCADRFRSEGVDVSQYGIPQQVEDMEAARAALGYSRIDLLSQSAGTRTAMIYAWKYPQRIHRSVMIGVNPPGHYLWDPKVMDEQLARYARVCAQDRTCSARTDNLAASMHRTAADMPSRWLFLPVNESNVKVFSFYGLMESSSEASQLSSPVTLDAWLAASHGDASGFWLTSVIGDLMPLPFAWGQYAAAGRVDSNAAAAYFKDTAPDSTNLGWVGSAFAWSGGRMVQGWPAVTDESTYSKAQTSTVETLLIGGDLDTSTPPQNATRDLLPFLPNGHQVILRGFGHTATFFTEQPAAGTRLINTFLANGQVDATLYRPQQVDFTPPTSLPSTAKMLAALMIGLAVVTILVLLSIWYRVRSRGGLGRSTGIAVRTAGAVLLGLGGWFLGALVVMLTLPAVPLGDPLLATVSVGLPVALAVYGGWVRGETAGRTKWTTFGLTLAAGLLGAWLGYHAIDGLLALISTIVGGVIGANLVLLLADLLAGPREVPTTVVTASGSPAVPTQRTESTGADTEQPESAP